MRNFNQKNSWKRLRLAAFAASAAASGLLVAEACAAIDLAAPQLVAGQWDMILNDTNRKCRLTLRTDATPGGFQIAMPAGCRRALPILSEVGAWTLPDRSKLELDDASGKLVLAFNAGASETLSAQGPDGETYEMVAANGVQLAQLAKPAPVPAFEKVKPPANVPAPSPVAAAPVVAAAPPPSTAALAFKPADVPGRYSVYRDGGKDTGCMITLDEKAAGLSGKKAQLAPACRDQGLVIFDPAGWSIDKGRLTLTARKGHQTHLDLQGNGTWLKDPKEGKSLALKKFGP